MQAQRVEASVGEVVLQEGDEEATYVVLDLSALDDQALPAAGSRLQITDLDTATPKLELNDGRVLIGRYEETIGSSLLLSPDEGADGGHTVKYICHTERRLRFSPAQ